MANVEAATSTYGENGFVAPVTVLDAGEAAEHRTALDAVEAELGPVHYINKIHTVMASAYELASHPTVLDFVESVIGPDILLYNTNYIIKEPGSAAHITWHQDLTYWGLDDDDAQVSMWLALSPATAESGCMTMIPGSHTGGRVEHAENSDGDNLLLLGQHITDVDESAGVYCTLEPGEASFHHGWTVHRSTPNVSSDRRIGLNVQYVAPHNLQHSAAHSATLLRGEDRFGHYGPEPKPQSWLDKDAAESLYAADQAMKESFQTK